MAGSEHFVLSQDRQGMVWDLLLYIPTVSGLGAAAAIIWHGQNFTLSYVMLFLACFFLYQGVHRILGRLMLLPSNPVELDVSKKRVLLKLRDGQQVELAKDVRYFSDYAGKSFGLTGMDLTGKRRQYVFHKGQFVTESNFKKVGTALKIYG
jgi:hypothetical protein